MFNSVLRRGIVAGALAVGLTMSWTASAGNILEDCAEGLKTHCGDVTPGNGRFYACLYAHEDKISGACDASAGDVMDMLDRFFELVRYSKQECAADIEKLCTGVEVGGGRIFTCLKENEADLSGDCATVVKGLGLPKE